ncbi:hypothetical protein D3C83_40960 [compost metagenome]
MAHHHDAVFRDRAVEFQRGDADRKRAGKCGQGIFGRKPARAAMALQIERLAGRGGHDESDGRNPAGKGVNRES